MGRVADDADGLNLNASSLISDHSSFSLYHWRLVTGDDTAIATVLSHVPAVLYSELCASMWPRVSGVDSLLSPFSDNCCCRLSTDCLPSLVLKFPYTRRQHHVISETGSYHWPRDCTADWEEDKENQKQINVWSNATLLARTTLYGYLYLGSLLPDADDATEKLPSCCHRNKK